MVRQTGAILIRVGSRSHVRLAWDDDYSHCQSAVDRFTSPTVRVAAAGNADLSTADVYWLVFTRREIERGLQMFACQENCNGLTAPPSHPTQRRCR